MIARMITGRHHSQIVQAVIGLIQINVVDELISAKFSSKMLLHDVPMFKNMSVIDGNLPIAVGSPSPLAIGDFLTKKRTAVSPKSLIVSAAISKAIVAFSAAFYDAKIRGLMFLEGYQAFGEGAHEAEVSYMRRLKFPEADVRVMNELRYSRNGILYYGEDFNKMYGEKVLAYFKKMYPKLMTLGKVK